MLGPLSHWTFTRSRRLLPSVLSRGSPGLVVCGCSALSNVRLCPPVPSLPAVPESLSCSAWGKAVRMPGQEIQLQVVIMPLICLISLDRYSGLNCVPHTQKGGFPGGTSGKEPAGQRTCGQRRGCNPWVRKTPWRTAWEPTPVFLPGESHGQRSQAGYSPWGRKETQLSD